MKKKYLTYAGIISAVILFGMFIMVFFIRSPVLFLIPAFTVDPLTDRSIDAHGFLVLSGKTSLPREKHIYSYVFSSQDNGKNNIVARGNVWIIRNDGERNLWNGTINISSLEPAEYQIVFKTVDYSENFTKAVESGPIASVDFILGNSTCTGACIRKKEQIEIPFIRINPVSEEPGSHEITGITSLPPGTPLGWKIEEKTGTAKTGHPGYGGICRVTRGTEGVNRWSFVPGISGISPGSYQITVTADVVEDVLNNLPDIVSGSVEFNYTSRQDRTITGNEKRPVPGTASQVYLTLDALPKMAIDEKYMITGTTNLPPGEMVYFQVCTPDMFKDYNVTFNPRDNSQVGEISGVLGCTIVENGSGKDNLWAFTFETYFLAPGLYEVKISNQRPEPDSLEIKSGNISYSRIFTLYG